MFNVPKPIRWYNSTGSNCLATSCGRTSGCGCRKPARSIWLNRRCPLLIRLTSRPCSASTGSGSLARSPKLASTRPRRGAVQCSEHSLSNSFIKPKELFSLNLVISSESIFSRCRTNDQQLGVELKPPSISIVNPFIPNNEQSP